MSKRTLVALLLLLLACEPAAITVYELKAAGGHRPGVPTAGSGGSVAASGGSGGAMSGQGGEAATAAPGGQGGEGGMGGSGAGGEELSTECLPAPPGHCGGDQPAFGWVCWGGSPHSGCEPAAEQVPQAGAETWCCSESCAPQPYYDDACTACDPATPRYFNCYQDLTELPGCASFGSYAVCCP